MDRLPDSTEGTPATPPSAAAPPPPAGEAILVVAANTPDYDLLARQIELMGYTPHHAASRPQALEQLHARPFDLVLLDLVMPDLDGYGVLTALKVDPALQRISVIVLSVLADMTNIVRAVELGADDYLLKPFDPVLLKARIGACLFKKGLRDLEVDYLKRIKDEKRRADDLLHVIIPLGIALTVEKDFNHLLEKIVLEAQALCNADGGTLYLRTEDNHLRFVIVRNRSLNIAMGGVNGKDIPFPPLHLYDEQSGAPLFNYVVTHAALEGKTINIADAYNEAGYDFSGTRDFDRGTGYRTMSVLNIPLKDGNGQIIGVLQLINAQNDMGQVIAFDAVAAQMLESLGALAAAALAAYVREQQLKQEIAELRIEIDQVRKRQEVDQIVSTPYFADLREKAQAFRSGAALAQNESDRREGLPDRREGLPDRRADPVERRAAPVERREVPVERHEHLPERQRHLPERRVFNVAGQELVAREQGPPTGRLLLMMHGWSSSWYALSPMMDTLSERYRCVSVDLPGYGESPRLPKRTAIPAYADLMVGLIQQLSPRQPALVMGHSMGGMIALTMALRHHEAMERMVLLCPTISGKLSFWINAFISPITMLERSPVGGGIIAGLEPYMLSVTDRLMRPASFAQRTGISEADYHRLRADARRPGQGRVRAECFWAMRANNLETQLERVTVPALVIWGMEDNTVPLSDASLVADKWPSAELRVLPKAGHWPQFETPEPTRRHVRAFLSTPVKLLKGQFAL